MVKKKTLEDIFNDDEFGILDSNPKNANVKSEDERLIESFMEINAFFEKNNREPEATNVTEFKLLSRLKAIRQDPKKVEILKVHDAHNLLHTKEEVKSVSDILKDDDFGILDTEETLSIFELKNIANINKQLSDYVGRRKAMKDKDFESYEKTFKIVHQEIKKGTRKIIPYDVSDLKEGAFYVLDGVLMFFEESDIEMQELSTKKIELDGRTKCVFENGTYSDMKYRSLKRALLLNGRTVTHSSDTDESVLFNNLNAIKEEDLATGWIYILKSKSTNNDIAALDDLYKIGYSTVPVQERIKNAEKEPTYLMADVQIIEVYKTYNLNAQKFEQLIHRFFAEVCLNIDIYDNIGRRITPREWFVVPLPIIDRVIGLILSGEIVDYSYDKKIKQIIPK